MPRPMPRPLTRDDIRHAIDLSSFNRGLRYFQSGHVIDLAEESRDALGVRLQSRVKGSDGRFYRQTIWIPSDPERGDIEGSCGCPVGYNCKHVAAACLAFEVKERLAGSGDGPADHDFMTRWLRRVVLAGTDPAPADDGERLIYVLQPSPADSHGVTVELRVARPQKRAGGLTKGRLGNLFSLYYGASPPEYMRPADHDILGLLRAQGANQWVTSIPLLGTTGGLALTRLALTGRCFWQGLDRVPIGPGEPRILTPRWQETPDGHLRLELTVAPAAIALLVEPPLYLDPAQGRLGPLETGGLRGAQLRELLAAPRLRASEAEAISRTLVLEFPELPLPTPVPVALAELTDLAPVPWLALDAQVLDGPGGESEIHLLRLDFGYGGHRVPGLPTTPTTILGSPKGPVRIGRDLEDEQAALATLGGMGFVPLPATGTAPGPHRLVPAGTNAIERAGRWSTLLREGLATLESAGWRVERETAFRLQFESADWDLELEDQGEERGNDWFGLRFDLDLGGRRIPLLPIIAPLLELGIDSELPEVITLPLDPTGTDPDRRPPLRRSARGAAKTLHRDPARSVRAPGADPGRTDPAVPLRRRRARRAGGPGLCHPRGRAAAGAGTAAQGLLGHRVGGAPCRSHSRAAPLPAARTRLAPVPARLGPGRHPGGRHGTRQDHPGTCPPAGGEGVRPPRPSGPGGGTHEPHGQLAPGGGALRPGVTHPGPARVRPPRPVRVHRRPRPDPDHLPPAPPGPGSAQGPAFPQSDPGRGPDRQEPQVPGRRRRAHPQRRSPALSHRHPHGEPPGRALGPIRLPDARFPRRPMPSSNATGAPPSSSTGTATARTAWPGGSPPSCSVGASRTWPPSCRPRPRSSRA